MSDDGTGISQWLNARDQEQAGFPVSPLAQSGQSMREGAFYWVHYSKLTLAEDNRTYRPDDKVLGPEPARFTGISGGSPPRPTWDFLGEPSDVESREVRGVGPEIVFDYLEIRK